MKKISLVNYKEKFLKVFLFENIENKLRTMRSHIEKQNNLKREAIINNFNMKIYSLYDKYINSSWFKEDSCKEKTSNYHEIILEDNISLKIVNKSSGEDCHIKKENGIMMVEDVPFKEIVDTVIEYNILSKNKKNTINGMDVNDYIDKYYEIYAKKDKEFENE